MIRCCQFLLRTIVLSLCLACSACSSPAVSSIIELVISPTPTNTPTPTITPTPTPTSTPEPTPTPMPQEYSITEILANCKAIAAIGNRVIVEGNIYLPRFTIYGYETWKGMQLSPNTVTNTTSLTALIKLGDTANTMDPIPEYFSQRDLVIRTADGMTIRDGHTVRLLGHVEYKLESKNLRCALRVEEITTLMPVEVSIPAEYQIAQLLQGMPQDNLCTRLAFKNQLVTLRGAVVKPASGVTCGMGTCEAAIADATGQILLSIVQGDGTSSMMAQTGAASPAEWQFYDSTGKQADSQDITLTGVLYSDARGCRIIVYEVGQQ